MTICWLDDDNDNDTDNDDYDDDDNDFVILAIWLIISKCVVCMFAMSSYRIIVYNYSTPAYLCIIKIIIIIMR